MRNIIFAILLMPLLAGCPDDGIPNSVYRGMEIACKRHGGVEGVKKVSYSRYAGTCRDNHKVDAEVR